MLQYEKDIEALNDVLDKQTQEIFDIPEPEDDSALVEDLQK